MKVNSFITKKSIDFTRTVVLVLVVVLIAVVLPAQLRAEEANQAPTLNPIGGREGQEGEWFVIPRIIATDPDDDTLTIQAANLPSGVRFFPATSSPGYVEYKLRWPDRFVKAGTYTPTFTVTDGNGGTDSETITITIDIAGGNQPPEFSPPPTPEQYGTEGVEFRSEVITLIDPDGPNLNFVPQNLPAGARISMMRIAPPNLLDFRITWPAEHVVAGDYTVTLVANDGIAPQVSESITIHIAGTGSHDPILHPIGDKQGQEGEWFVIPRIIATDPDDDTLTIQAANLPSGIRFFPATSSPGYVEYKLRWPDRFVKAGTYTPTFTVTDGNGGTDSETITIAIIDTTPPGQPTVNSVTSPTNLETQIITGTKSDDTAAILVTSSQATISPLSYPTSTNWSCTVTLQEGNNDFAVIAEDEAGNQSQPVAFAITLDIIPPEVIITSPEDNAVVTTSEITLEGTVDEIPFSETRTLQEGENIVTKQATDAAGNTSEASVKVFYYTAQVIGPEGGIVISQNGDIVLEIPEGALDTPQAIIAIDRNEEDFPDAQIPQDTKIVGALQIMPAGVTFQKPVKLRLPLDEPQIPGTPLEIFLLPEPNGFFAMTSSVSMLSSEAFEIKEAAFESAGNTSYVDTGTYTATTEINHLSIYVALKNMISSGTPIGGGVDIPTPDLFTGAFTHDIPIEIPKGRRNMHPNLSLQYRSGNPNDWTGFGWQLNLGYIQRSTKHGTPAYNDDDTFVFVSQSQSQELVHLAGNLYQAKVEGAFIKYYKESDDTWYLLTKDGNKMYLGQTSASKQTTQRGIFAWYLTKAVDPNGNYTEFNYAKHDNKVYLDNILYTGNEDTGASPRYEVKFYLEDRTDISSSYISGEECKITKRLDHIEVFCDSDLVWTYQLGYTYSPDTSRSLLTAITQKGSDGASYPTKTFGYQVK